MLKKIFRKINMALDNERVSRSLDTNYYRIHPSAFIYNKQNISLAEKTTIAEYVIIRAPMGKIVIGKNSEIGPFSVLLGGEEGIKIGENVMIAPHCVFAAGNHEYRNLNMPMIFAGTFSKGPIIIEDDVWIGANCTIADNVTISKGAIIGANSFINKNVDPYDIVAGVPGRKISSRLKYKKD